MASARTLQRFYTLKAWGLWPLVLRGVGNVLFRFRAEVLCCYRLCYGAETSIMLTYCVSLFRSRLLFRFDAAKV